MGFKTILIEVIRPRSYYDGRQVLEEVMEEIENFVPGTEGIICFHLWPDLNSSLWLELRTKASAPFLVYYLDGVFYEELRVTELPLMHPVELLDYLQARREGRIREGEYFSIKTLSKDTCSRWSRQAIAGAMKSIDNQLKGRFLYPR